LNVSVSSGHVKINGALDDCVTAPEGSAAARTLLKRLLLPRETGRLLKAFGALWIPHWLATLPGWRSDMLATIWARC